MKAGQKRAASAVKCAARVPRRSVQMPFRLTPQEAERLNLAAARAGLAREAYIRIKLFKGPPLAKDVSPQLFCLTKEVNCIGVNIRQTARIACASGTVSGNQIDLLIQALEDVEQAIAQLRDQITRP